MSEKPIFTADTVRFFRDLGRNNNKPWMDEHRDRYRTSIVEPFRLLLLRLAPAAAKLNPRLVITGRTGDNFSRINRDIRFARDKTPYRTQMYLQLSEPGGQGGQLYVGISARTATAGFRIYGGEKTSPLAQIGRARGTGNCKWVLRLERRLGRKYDSYWYSSEKREWTKHDGWPVAPENWKKLQAWIVRRKFAPAAAARRGFEAEVVRVFRDVHPLLPFMSSPRWKP